MDKSLLTAEELIEILKGVHPKSVIAVSDYFGMNHQLYRPSVTAFKKGDSFQSISDVDHGTIFVDRQNRFKQNTVYIGHPSEDKKSKK